LGLTFKENVNDSRNSKIADTIADLKQNGAHVEGHDPHLTQEVVTHEFGIKLVKPGKYDAIILATPHREFKELTLDKLRKHYTGKPVLIDVKGILNKEEARTSGYVYYRL